MYACAGILIFGHDAILLETRRLILKRAGFHVWIAINATDALQALAKEPIDLFILCQSLSLDECDCLLKAAHLLRPEMDNLVLGGHKPGLSANKQDTFLTSFLDPASLISLIQNMIAAKNGDLILTLTSPQCNFHPYLS